MDTIGDRGSFAQQASTVVERSCLDTSLHIQKEDCADDGDNGTTRGTVAE